MRGVTVPGFDHKLDRCISTRTPHAGSDRAIRSLTPVQDRFQPALPMRGVTRAVVQRRRGVLISTRTPHAGSDGEPHSVLGDGRISTRTPHAGSDRNIMRKFTASINI